MCERPVGGARGQRRVLSYKKKSWYFRLSTANLAKTTFFVLVTLTSSCAEYFVCIIVLAIQFHGIGKVPLLILHRLWNFSPPARFREESISASSTNSR